jgi:glucan phosphoethanolaminetransferase (alkaline phosphatase superfamily)
VERFKRVLNVVKDVLLVTTGIIINIFTIIIVAICVITPPFIAAAVICQIFPFIRNPIGFGFVALVMFILWLVVIVYVFLPIFERLEDRWFRESAPAIVEYKRMKWSAKLIDEKKNQDGKTCYAS